MTKLISDMTAGDYDDFRQSKYRHTDNINGWMITDSRVHEDYGGIPGMNILTLDIGWDNHGYVDYFDTVDIMKLESHIMVDGHLLTPIWGELGNLFFKLIQYLDDKNDNKAGYIASLNTTGYWDAPVRTQQKDDGE